jgi:hypothetical protein
MTAQQAANFIYLRATRKSVTVDLTQGKGAQILSLMDFFQTDWAGAPGVNWHSLRSTFTLPATVTATNSFSLSTLTTLNHISQQEGDFVRIYGTNGTSEYDYTVVDAATLYDDGPQLNGGGASVPNAIGTCAQVGTNLVFDQAFTATSAQFGGTIKLPGYLNANTIAAAADVIQVDDPQWLIVRVAAEYVLNDTTRVAHYAPLKDEADAKWNDMVAANNSQRNAVYTGGFSPLGQTWS